MRRFILPLLFLISFLASVSAQPLFDACQWRCIGPHRGGRTVGATGIPAQPNVFYIGVNNGGVWRTDDYGRTWQPIFDSQPTGSIGDIAVSPSNPQIIYVATGEGLHRPDLSTGDGIYKSTDGGKTWTNTGLREAQQIAGLAIDPANPDRVFAAVLGHPYGPNPDRGVYRTLDGGKTWQKVKFIDENTGAMQVTIDPTNPNIIYADLYEGRLAPWENGRWLGPGSGLWKSTDGGNTWFQLKNGLPTPAQGLGRIGFCIAPSNPQRLYATVDCGEYTENGRRYGGIYRSDDGGINWVKTNPDPRLWGRGEDFAEVKCDPKNADIVYSANVVTWKSVDGGVSWQPFRGAPGGDDYHRIWINPNDNNIMLLASDQGAIITVNGGRTFSSWYNQPTAQFYHVSTDNAFPYNVYGGQQESGSVGIASRGNDGQITYREWHPVGAEEWGYVAADPLNPDIIYGGKLSRYNKKTGQTQQISPKTGSEYRFLRTAPVLFHPADPTTLFYAGNVLFKTRDGGQNWTVISPDLSRETYPDIPACVGKYTEEAKATLRRRGVIYTIAPSPLDTNLIWAGTDDGLIHITRDGGKNWNNVTPKSIPVWGKVSLMEASHFDPKVAYAAVNCIRLDDMRPHIFKTTDGGQTWQEITGGLPNEPINAVREDHKNPKLLFAGSERAVYCSLDGGASWQSLRLNMPATSIRDLVIKDDDLVVGTHGRSFWILDNFSPLRVLELPKPATKPTPATPVPAPKTTSNKKKGKKAVATEPAPTPVAEAPVAAPQPVLFPIQTSYRVRWNTNTDTPVPQEEPAGQNPPDGVMIDYYLPRDAEKIVLYILDANGKIVRTYRMNDRAPNIAGVNIPLYWIRQYQALSNKKGHHRFLWDMRRTPVANESGALDASFPIAAVYGQTTPNPYSPMVMPGKYKVRLSVDGQKLEQMLDLRMDPRVQITEADLKLQYDLSLSCETIAYEAGSAVKDAISLQKFFLLDSIDLSKNTRADMEAAVAEFNQKIGQIQGFASQARYLFEVIQDVDAPPTMQVRTAVEQLKKDWTAFSTTWNKLFENDKEPYATAQRLRRSEIKSAGLITDAHPAADEPGFVPLYNDDLSNTIRPEGIWSITGGELTATEDQCIWTREKYTDFILDLEFKTAAGTNSGVIFHCSDPVDWIPNSVEVQIADDYAEQWAKADPTWQCGALFGQQAAAKRLVKPAGEWNHYTITCVGRQIWVVLNGELVNTIDMNRFLGPSKSAPWLWKPLATLPLEGHIGFQGKHAGAPIWFRNVRVKRL